MIVYKQGNLLDSTDKFIAHGVNCQGKMNSGVARDIREKYPEVYEDFMEVSNYFHFPRSSLLGVILLTPTNNHSVYSIFSQEYYGKDGEKYVSYDALDKGFEKINKEMEADLISLPRIGCGLGGGNWSVVEAIINHRLKDKIVTVWDNI